MRRLRRPAAPTASRYSGTPLAKKLGIRAGCRLYLRGAPAGYPALVAPLPEGVRIVSRVSADTDLMHLFVRRRGELERALTACITAMRADAGVWVSWPKKTSNVPSELNDGAVRELGLAAGLVDIKVCAVDATWSALKFVVRTAERAAFHPARDR